MKFDAQLTYLATFGPDAESGPMLLSSALAVGPDGSIYVGDWPVDVTGQERIVIFDATGAYQRTIVLPKGYGPGQFENIAGIAVNVDGALYTVDTSTDFLQKLQPDGTPVWTTQGLRSTFNNPRSLAISPTGQLLITDDYTYVSEGVTQYGSAVLQYALDGQPDPFTERILYHQTENFPIVGVTVTPDGQVALTQLNTNTMDIYAANWDYVDTLEPVSNPPLQPMGAATDADGNYYIADLGNARVVKLAPDGSVLDVWVGSGQDDGQFLSPMDVAVFGQRVYVTDWQRGQVLVFTTDGAFITAWGDEDGPGGLVSPRGIDVDQAGNVYVVDSDDVGRVNKYAPDGTWLVTVSGGEDEALHYPWGIAVAANGAVYVADSGNDRIVAYQPTN
jgi:DNA-binding beta-propeller fold protein YncE